MPVPPGAPPYPEPMALDLPRTLTPSKVTAFTNCPLAFRYSQIERRPAPPSPPAVKGTLIHSTLEELFWRHPPGARTPDAAALELARLHALERIQFGRPIASFQAVRHRLAEALVSLEAASALATAAWEEPNPGTAALAKGLAGRSARTVVRHAQQVLAGIGFTLEHPLHRYVRRTMLLDQLLGAGAALTRQSGADLLATGALPATLPL